MKIITEQPSPPAVCVEKCYSNRKNLRNRFLWFSGGGKSLSSTDYNSTAAPQDIRIMQSCDSTYMQVKYQHLVCAAKKLQNVLLEAGNEGVDDIVHKYEQECH